jgi:protein-S-isoprenylcysteine O-methyltransferase Ste14
VLADEARLRAQFGAQYTRYEAQVKRWIPALL